MLWIHIPPSSFFFFFLFYSFFFFFLSLIASFVSLPSIFLDLMLRLIVFLVCNDAFFFSYFESSSPRSPPSFKALPMAVVVRQSRSYKEFHQFFDGAFLYRFVLRRQGEFCTWSFPASCNMFAICSIHVYLWRFFFFFFGDLDGSNELLETEREREWKEIIYFELTINQKLKLYYNVSNMRTMKPDC